MKRISRTAFLPSTTTPPFHRLSFQPQPYSLYTFQALQPCWDISSRFSMRTAWCSSCAMELLTHSCHAVMSFFCPEEGAGSSYLKRSAVRIPPGAPRRIPPQPTPHLFMLSSSRGCRAARRSNSFRMISVCGERAVRGGRGDGAKGRGEAAHLEGAAVVCRQVAEVVLRGPVAPRLLLHKSRSLTHRGVRRERAAQRSTAPHRLGPARPALTASRTPGAS